MEERLEGLAARSGRAGGEGRPGCDGGAGLGAGGAVDKGKILVADDERELADLVETYLRREGFDTVVLCDGGAALERVRSEEFDLAVLDIMLPGASGLEVLSEIRERFCYPVIMLTAKGGQSDKIGGLSLGADDYVTKPFMPLELVARVKAQLRRARRYNAFGTAEPEGLLVAGGLVMNVSAHECTLDDRPLLLTPTEFSLLQVLLEAKGSVVSARDLYRTVWGDAYYSRGSGSIAVHIRHLREKMGDSFEEPKYIKTVWGCGYKIDE